MLTTTTIQEICDKIAGQYTAIVDMVAGIGSNDPDYFPLVTKDDDLDFELKMNPVLVKGDSWNISDIVKASPLKPVCGGLMTYFSTTKSYDQIQYIGSLDNYLYINGMTVSENFADALALSTGYLISGWVVTNAKAFIFAEFGKDDENSYFTSFGSFQTDNRSAPYGTFNGLTTYAPTDKVVIEIVEAANPIIFDIELICKDENGDPFVFEQSLSGEKGDSILLNLTKKITGVSGLQTPYSGETNDMLRIKTLPSEV